MSAGAAMLVRHGAETLFPVHSLVNPGFSTSDTLAFTLIYVGRSGCSTYVAQLENLL